MKITFLGVSGALSAKYNSNMLIESDGQCMLFDCGEDVMHSLKAAGRKPEELTDVYISHLHYDHMGGLSWLGYYSYFILKKRLILHIHESMVSDLWAMLRPAMEKLDCKDEMMTLDNYFDVVAIKGVKTEEYNPSFFFGKCYFDLVEQLHVETVNGNMYSYGLNIIDSTNKSQVFISSDSKKMSIPYSPYSGVSFPQKYIFCDCDVMNLNGVHPNYNDLKKYKADTKSKMWLYHYTNLDDYEGKFGEMPDAVADGFAGFVKEGQIFEI
jgi:hypothetical protein